MLNSLWQLSSRLARHWPARYNEQVRKHEGMCQDEYCAAYLGSVQDRWACLYLMFISSSISVVPLGS